MTYNVFGGMLHLAQSNPYFGIISQLLHDIMGNRACVQLNDLARLKSMKSSIKRQSVM